MRGPAARIVHVDGIRIAYYRRGSGATVLFIMGLGGRAGDWNERFLDRMAERFEVVSFDNRGTGKSDEPAGEYSLERMADEAVAVLDALGRPRAHVVGISMGGMIAQLVALRHPARVARLALIATHGGGRGVVSPTAAALAVLRVDRSRPRADFIRDAMATIAAPGFAERNPTALDELTALALAEPTSESAFARQLAAVMASDRSAQLATIAVPTLIVHGSDDPLIPFANGVALARTIPGAQLVTLAGCGHLPMWECPGRLADALESFLATD